MSTIRFLVRDIWRAIKLASFRSKWCNTNRHNCTVPNNIFPMERVTVGKGTYADLNVYSYRNIEERLTIGNYCSIASDVIFLLSGEHNMHLFSTYPFAEKYFGKCGSAICKGPIIVEDDVWIGVRVTVLSGVTIGKGAVIGAGSTVNKDVPSYSIYAGTQVIGKRFDDEISRRLMEIDFGKIDIERIKKIARLEINVNNVDEVMKCLNTITG